MHNHLLMLTKRATAITAGAVLIAVTTAGCGGSKKSSPPNPVQISPSLVTLSVDGQQQFTATVNGAVSPVFWTVKGSSADGTITAGGLYTAPPSPGFYTVIATNSSNSGQSNSVVVSVVAGSASGTLQ